MSPEEAAAELDRAEAPGSAVTVMEEPISSVEIHCRMGGVEVVGDPSVQQAVAEGDHVARRDGDRLVIEVSALGDPDSEGFRFRHGAWGAWSPWGFVHQPNSVRIRMRPDLALRAEVEAGAVTARGMAGSFQAEVSAGACTLSDFTGQFDVRVAAGSFKADALLREGVSRLVCEAGSAKVNLRPGSGVRVISRSTMGSVKLLETQGSGGRSFGSSRNEAVVGSGEATLEIDSRVGSIRVTADG